MPAMPERALATEGAAQEGAPTFWGSQPLREETRFFPPEINPGLVGLNVYTTLERSYRKDRNTVSVNTVRCRAQRGQVQERGLACPLPLPPPWSTRAHERGVLRRLLNTDRIDAHCY